MSNPRTLTEHDIDQIAERVAERALEKFYAKVGRSVVTKVFWMASAVVVGVYVWLGGGK